MYRNRHEAGAALRAMGPVAEEAAIGCLSDRDRWVRKETCGVLAEIGGRAALDALEAFAQKATGFDLQDAQHAIDAIHTRLESQPEPAENQPQPVETVEPEYRIWHDASGLFEIEAELVKSGDGTVTLQRKAGGIVTVPLDKLSEDDRRYVADKAKQ